MRLVCDHCGRSLEFAGPRPSFCGYCGKAFASTPLTETADYQPQSTSTLEGATLGLNEEAPAQIGDYKVIRPLGGGGMGVVYEAESSSGQRVAVKLMRPEVRHSSASEERFRQEGRLASGIAHPRCVFVHGVDQEADRPYIVMELMTGETLKDLVQRDGPLAPLDAVAKIIDVIDGLREAHALGVIHRDVKPSNCFLEADGRVKVGDFGLSRSLTTPSHLTQTGGFLGTVLFASPEQHKGEGVDVRTDVYSVCATLFYLLTGRAPFEDSLGSAAIARIVTEDAPSTSKFRANVPKPLVRIVKTGLERLPERRFQTLDELRAELTMLLPGRLSVSGIATRAAAYIFDTFLVQLSLGAIVLAIAFLIPSLAARFSDDVSMLLSALTITAYFAILEGRSGASLGKRLLRLRVTSAVGEGAPGWGRILLRSAVFCMLFEGSQGLFSQSESDADGLRYFGVWIGTWLFLLSTMRPRNGYRMLHEMLSGTRVVQLPWPQSTPKLKGRPLDERSFQPLPPDSPARLGRFAVRGLIEERSDGRFLLGEDAELDRRVVLWMRRGSPLSIERRNNARATRFRWLEGGRDSDFVWDAFLTPRGSPLSEVVADNGKLEWSVVRPMLEQLAEELQAASADESLPLGLKPSDVWMHTNGNVQLADWPLEPAPPSAAVEAEASGLQLLREAAILALEGKPRTHKEAGKPIRAVLPLHARTIVNRLIDAKEPVLKRMLVAKRSYESIPAFQAALAETKNRPARVTVSHRVLQASLMAIPLCILMAILSFASRTQALWDLTQHERGLEERVWERAFGAKGLRNQALVALPNDHPLRLRPESFDAAVARGAETTRLRLAERRRELRWLGNALARFRIFGHLEEFHPDGNVDRIYQAPTAENPILIVALKRPFPWGGTRLEAFDIGVDSIEPRPFLWVNQYDGTAKETLTRNAWALAIVVWVVWMAWGFGFGGGLSYRLAGIAFVRRNGKRAAGLRLIFRALLFWLPFAALFSLAYWIDLRQPSWAIVSEGVHWLTLLLLGLFVVAIVRSPDRQLHDRLSGVYLVPR
jgi:eukaryotic-like serine/threonine-protein kinase